MKPMRPILRYHGGKWLLAPWIISYFPEHRIYVESFGGAASVLLRKVRSYAEIYNDMDGEIVNLFRVVRDRGDELAKALSLTPFSRAEYYAAMEISPDSFESARRLTVRSFMGFGSDSYNEKRRSGFRASSNRSGTTPAHDWAHYPECLQIIIHRLQGVVIENAPAIKVMSDHDGPETLHYCDPPYVHSTRSAKGHSPNCYRHEMTEDDHRELALFLRGLKGMVIVSGYDSLLYRDLYIGWKKAKKRALADGAKVREEILWMSPNIQETMLISETEGSTP